MFKIMHCFQRNIFFKNLSAETEYIAEKNKNKPFNLKIKGERWKFFEDFFFLLFHISFQVCTLFESNINNMSVGL